MAQLFFKYGTMNSSKTADLIMTAYNYQSSGRDVIVFTSGTDTRSDTGTVESRVGLSTDAIPIYPKDKIRDVYESYLKVKGTLGTDIKPSCIFVDEVQFLSEDQIFQLTHFVDQMNIPVVCYGLKTDFQGRLFEGSKALIELADKLIEIKTVCHYCDRKAAHNLRTVNGKPVYEGKQIQVGDQEYIPVCRYHFYLNKM